MWSTAPITVSVLFSGWLLASHRAGAAEASGPGRAANLPSYPLEPVYRLKPVEGRQRYVTRDEPGFAALPVDGIAFLAVCTNEWPTGLVPLFAVEKTNRIELRRRPPQGIENSSEPLFFALPLEDEVDAPKIAGRWDCQAIRASGDKSYLTWELAIEADQIAGRFDQGTEYRVASLTGGTFRSNRIELRVEYFNDVYLLTGAWRDNRLRGEWRHTDDSERGTWEAQRGANRFANPGGTVLLYEWRRSADNARRYGVEGERLESSWVRVPRPLCRVWAAGREH